MATPKTFQWGAGGTKLTPADVARNRSLAAALLAKKGKPQNVTQGINRFSEALLHNVLNKRAGKAETAGRATATDIMAKIMGGGGNAPIRLPTGGAPSEAPAVFSGEFDRDALHEAQKMAESGGDPNAVSPAGAEGLMQIMPATAANPGFGMQPLDDIRHPKKNEAFGREYMDKMLSRYDNNPTKALAAYNWGAGNADKWDGNMNSLPAETLNYINKIMGGQGKPVQMAQAQEPQLSGVNPQIMQLLNNQWASPAQKSVAQMLMKQGMGRQKLQEQRGYDAGLLTDDRANIAKLLTEKNTRDDRLSGEKRTNVAKLLAATQTREDMLRKEGRDFDLANPKPTTAQKNFEYSNANPGFTEWKNANKKAGATSVTVNGEPADGNLRKALDKNTGEQWGAYQKKGAESAAMAQDMQILDELITIAPQGPITGRLAEMFPGFSSAGDAFQSIVKRLAPQLRVEGSGSTSDIEYAGMLRGMPALQNKPEANALIAGIMKAKASINVERSGIVNDYARGDISAAFARKKMSELNKRSIMTPEMHKMLTGVGGNSSSLKTSKGPTKPGSEEEYNAIPSGELFVDPDDGKTYRKP